MADTRLYELEECVSPQADDILLIEESATQTDKKVKLSELMPTDAVESAVADWLTAHPEATTTVEDGSITPVKLATSTMDLFDEKADTVGEYDDMTVGNAKQLLSQGYTENKTPYIYRKSAGGDRVYEKLIGGTIAWNQLVVARGSLSFDRDTQRTRNLSTSNVIPVIGHKYFFSMNVVSENLTGSMHAQYGANLDFTHGTGIKNAIYSASTATPNSVYVYMASDESSGAQATIKDVMVIDLTAMFGSTIADHIYALEQATAGAGVAWFRQMFPNDYYAYDSGSLQSVNVASKKVVGFNQWDEEWEVGGLYWENGQPDNSTTTRFRSKNYCGIVGGIEYYKLNNSIFVFLYDENKNLIAYTNANSFTPTANAKYFKILNISSAVYNNDICINISDPTRNGTYKPYEEHTYTFDSDVTLRGLPKLDINNNLYYDGDVYESDGTVTRRYGIVDLGSLNWVKFLDQVGVFASTNDVDNMYVSGSNAVEVPIKCGKYVSGLSANELFDDDNLDNSIAANGVYPRFIVRDTSKNSLNATEFAAAMVGVYVLYPLATQTSENADSFINPQIVDADGTEEFVDYMQSQSTRDVAVPVGHESKYMINLRAKIEDAVMLPTLPTTNGTYTLKCIVASGTPTLSWVAD